MKTPLYLKKFWLKDLRDQYPFLPLVKQADGFVFRRPVTVFCGDNGAGKSTLAKILAVASDCVFVAKGSSEQVFFDNADAFGVSREGYPKRKFYFSAEDFISYIRVLDEKKADAYAAIDEIDRDPLMSDYAKRLAKSPHYETLEGIDRYGEMGACSHGESFLAFFDARLSANGLYIIDEPEAALSGENQYRLAYRIHQAAKEMNCQFVICTHSPIVAAIPQADIYEIADDRLTPKAWDEVEDVSFYKLFFSRKDKMFS